MSMTAEAIQVGIVNVNDCRSHPGWINKSMTAEDNQVGLAKVND